MRHNGKKWSWIEMIGDFETHVVDLMGLRRGIAVVIGNVLEYNFQRALKILEKCW